MADTPVVPAGVNPQAWQRLKPHVRYLLERIARKPRPAMQSLPFDLARQAYAAGSGVLESDAPHLPRVQELRIPRRDASTMPARLYAPQAQSAGILPVLLYYHGGGFVVGSVDTHDTTCRALSQQSGCAVISVDYRLAPEHPFPAAFNDAWDAVSWLWQQAATLGLDAHRIAVGGDSAGGTLAAACAIQAAKEGLLAYAQSSFAACAIQAAKAQIPIKLQLLFYPGMQAAASTPSRQLYANGFLLSEAQLQWMFANAVRSPRDYTDWRFSPVLADDIAGIAPLWLGLAECDPIVDDSLLWADKLRCAGVPVQLELYHGVIHEFIKMGRAIPEAHQALHDAAMALRQALQP